MKELPVEFSLPFLGSRTYLQGTTLFDAFLKYIPAPYESLSLKISRMISSDRIKIIAIDSNHDTRKYPAQICVYDKSSMHCFAAMPLPASPSIKRVPYDEGLVTRESRIESGSIFYDKQSPFSFSSTVVTLHKALLLHDISNKTAGQWLFARIDLTDMPNPFVPMQLRIQDNFRGQLVKSEIIVLGKMIGQVYFSWLPKTK